MAAPGPPKNIKSKKGPEQLAKEFAQKEEYSQRKKVYNFGKGKVPVVIPTKYPTEDEQGADVKGELALDFSMGYNGSDQTARNNVFVTADGKTLVYHLAAVGVCMDIESGKQRFYFGHNDDVSCLDLQKTYNSEGNLVASGQVDPKDRDKKATPSIHIWDVNTMERQCTIEDAAEMQVKCLAWSPKSQYLYSLGGDENQAMRMWDSKTFSKTSSPKPMIDNPTCKDEMFGLVFSPNPNPTGERTGTIDEFLMWGRRRAAWGYIKSANVKGNIKIFFQYRSINMAKVTGKGKSESVYLAGDFLPSGHWIVGSPKGNIYIGADVTPQKKISACGGFVGAIQVLDDGLFCAVSADKKIDFFNVQSGAAALRTDNTPTDMKIKSFAKDDSRGSGAINIDNANMVPRAIAYNKETGIAYVGSKDNKILSFDFNSKQGAIAMEGHGTGDGNHGAVWGMAACPCLPLFVTAGYDGQLKVIDLATREVVARYAWPVLEEEKSDGKTKTDYEAVTCLAWSKNGKLLAAGTETSKVTVFTWLKGVLKMEVTYPIIKVSATKKGSKPGNKKFDGVEPISFLRFSACNNFLAAAHYDSNAYMFSVRSMREYSKVELIPWKKRLPHTAATVGLQFSSDSLFLRTFNRNYEVMNWALNAQKKRTVVCPTIPDPDQWSFAHNPLIAGWDVQGLFMAGWDGTDLNCCAVNPDKNLTISGDDFGIVRLMNYPAVNPKSPNTEYQGHSAFVVNTEFSNDGGYAISCGGGDKAMFGWAVQPST